MKKDILTLDDVKLLVDRFYERVRTDALLGPIFEERIQDRWPAHLAKMYTFWQTVLLDEHTYDGAPFPPHAQLPVDHQHFEQWLQIFTSTADELFSGDKNDEAKWRAARMAELFERRIEHYRSSGNKSLI
ncbi:MAG: group III truncated hemoglobin [Bacteroidetes bacterium]|nr:group III truncated hemoglobin [Bacteroidota bacterium]